MKTKTAYISGPISGMENGNYEKFHNAQKQLEIEGYIVFNPHIVAKNVYDKWAKIEIKTSEQIFEMWSDFMRVDIEYLMKSDCVFLLDNWESSNGANLELLISQKLKIPIYYMKTRDAFDITFQIVKFNKVPI